MDVFRWSILVFSSSSKVLWLLILLCGLWTEFSVLAKRGRRINIYKQTGGDIVQLRPGARIRGPMMNALKSNSAHRWIRYKDPFGNFVVPYVITGKFQADERRIISGAMRAIEHNTCIRFRKRTNEADFVDVQNRPNEGCYTTVGRSPGRNVVMLEANEDATCVEHDIAIHELMHTIGLWHEQMRYDRDKYIKVHYENIDPIYYSQFEKVSSTESTTYGVPYDYQSVMHYAKDAFAERPGLITMETFDTKYQNLIGHVKDASPSDYVKICSIYSCKQCMGNVFTGPPSRPMGTTHHPTAPALFWANDMEG
jgi:hypothetical protein